MGFGPSDFAHSLLRRADRRSALGLISEVRAFEFQFDCDARRFHDQRIGMRGKGAHGIPRLVWIAILWLILLAPASAFATYHPGDPVRGKRTFRFCAFCHSLKPGEIRTGPSLAGLFGRAAGSVEGFNYSRALKNSTVIWNERTLDAWLANPRKFIPGNRMRFRGLNSPEIRANVVVFLKQATRPADQ